MIRLACKIPEACILAFSGGVDSVATLDFLLAGRRKVELAFFHHGTQSSEDAMHFVSDRSRQLGLRMTIGRLDKTKDKRQSWEEFWRVERYKFLDSFSRPVVTAHHLDDAVETWLFTSLHGIPRVIPVTRGRVIRPFLLTPKSEMIERAVSRGLTWVEDRTNLDVKFARNAVRHEVVPVALRLNPGLRKVVARQYQKSSRGLETDI